MEGRGVWAGWDRWQGMGAPDSPHPHACGSYNQVPGELMAKQGDVCYQGPRDSCEKGDLSSTADGHVCTHGWGLSGEVCLQGGLAEWLGIEPGSSQGHAAGVPHLQPRGCCSPDLGLPSLILGGRRGKMLLSHLSSLPGGTWQLRCQHCC